MSCLADHGAISFGSRGDKLGKARNCRFRGLRWALGTLVRDLLGLVLMWAAAQSVRRAQSRV